LVCNIQPPSFVSQSLPNEQSPVEKKLRPKSAGQRTQTWRTVFSNQAAMTENKFTYEWSEPSSK